MVRYKKLLKVLLTALYFKHGSEVSRDDYGMYMIYAYLAVVRLDDLGASVFTKFILAQVCRLFLLCSCAFICRRFFTCSACRRSSRSRRTPRR
jgi:hypothetical protein